MFFKGSDEKKIIEVICGYNCEQRQIIKNQFMKLYNQVFNDK